MLKNFVKYLVSGILQPQHLMLGSRAFHASKRNICRKLNPSITSQNHFFLHIDSSKNVKQFIESENLYARRILESFPITTNLADLKIQTDRIISNEQEFNTFLNQNWRTAAPSDIIKAFVNVADYCQTANINLSDSRFDQLVDGLMDHVEKLSVEELHLMLKCLIKLPLTDSFNSHNYHDVWSALDDMCCWKLKDWNIEMALEFANLFHQLHLGRIGDYIFRFIDKVSRRPSRLTQEQLVHTFFYMNVCRKRSVEFEFESAVEAKLGSLSVDEMAVISMGFFKSQTKIKLASILNRMLELVIENSENIHEISLASILKVVRLSQHPQTRANLIKTLNKIVLEMPRLSYICATHAVLSSTSLQVFHEPILKAVAQKCIDNISDIEVVRLKDIERLLLSTTMFNYDPKTTPDFYKTIYDELHKEERVPEQLLYPKSLPCSLTFLSIRNIYSEKLMNELLKPEFTKDVYGKNSKMFPRELFSLNLNCDIDFPDYKGNKWPAEMRQKACKWLIEYLFEPPTKNLSKTEKFLYDAIDTLRTITGHRKYLYVGHVLPQYAKPDIILCVDKFTNTFVKPTELESYQLHEIKLPKEMEKFKWFAFVIVSFNLTARNTFKPIGIVEMKERHLRRIGYKPILIKWNEYALLQEEEKIDYVLSRIKLT